MDSIETLIAALSNERVTEALSEAFQPLIQSAIDSALQTFSAELKKKDDKISKLPQDINIANKKIDSLEIYNRLHNLLITGLQVENYAEAASTASPRNNGTEAENSTQTEAAILEFFNQQLGVDIVKQDISISHRLKASRLGPPVIIVRFTNRKARENVFAARRQLQNTRIYINEDLTKVTAELFKHTRKLAKDKNIHSTWTRGGTVYVRVSDDPACKPKKVDDICEIFSHS